ncbi:hypothetical protein ES705_08095 [subsurface metagenome]
MRDYQTQKVIDEFFREEKKKKKLEHLKMWKNQNNKTRSKNKQKKKGFKVR